MKPTAIWNCTTKKRYDNREAAEQQADFLAATDNAYVDVYKCNICEGWHLTRQRVI
jgi:hypothetical protein